MSATTRHTTPPAQTPAETTTNHDQTRDRSSSAVARIQGRDQFTEAWLELGRQITATLASMGQAFDALQQARLLEEIPPTEPRARALWLRQHRNTGPTARGRAPKHLDTTARRRTR